MERCLVTGWPGIFLFKKNVMKAIKKYIVLLSLSLLIGYACNQQGSEKNLYGLHVLSTIDEYTLSVKGNPANELVDLEQFIPGIVTDIRYAGTNNFTGMKVYDQPRAFLRLPVAMALQGVNNELHTKGLGIKVFDAYRPYSATVKFHEIISDTNFVAHPSRGSKHNRGCAVDLTIIVLETGHELEMPTLFDDFTEKAAVNFSDLPDTVLANRKLLIDIMTKYDFTPYEHEWWHYDYVGWENFDLMDISFEALDRAGR